MVLEIAVRLTRQLAEVGMGEAEGRQHLPAPFIARAFGGHFHPAKQVRKWAIGSEKAVYIPTVLPHNPLDHSQKEKEYDTTAVKRPSDPCRVLYTTTWPGSAAGFETPIP